jgi:hypothetical protein
VRRYLGDVEGVALEDGKFKIKGVKGDANKSKDIMPDAVFYLENGRVVVAVEMKHVTGRLNGEPVEQMKRYAELVNNPAHYGFEGAYIEVRYIFSSQGAAFANVRQIKTRLGAKGLVFYLEIESGSLVELEL